MAITAAKRRSIPKGLFASPSNRKYPIDTPKRARAALSYGARNAGPTLLHHIRVMVHEHYPSIKQKGKKAPGSMAP